MFYRFLLLATVSVLLLGCGNKDSNRDIATDEIKTYELLEKVRNKELELEDRLVLLDSAFSKPLELTDSLKLVIYSLKSSLHYFARQRDSSFYYDRLLLKKALSMENHHFSAEANMNIARYYKWQGIYDSAYYYNNDAKKDFQKLNDSSKVGRRLLSMGVLQQDQNDFFGSKETLTEALNYLQSKKDHKYITSVYSELATNHRKLNNFDDAVGYLSKAIETSNSVRDLLIYKNNLAVTYIDNRELDKAIKILEGIKKDSLIQGNKIEYARVLDNLAYAKWRGGDYLHTEKELLNALSIRIQNNDKRGQIASYTHLGEYQQKRNSKKAWAYFDTVIQLARQLKIPKAEQDALGHLMGLAPDNVELRDRYIFLLDSLYEQELKVKTQFAKYKYDDRLKQEAINRLQSEKANQQLKMAEERAYKILYLLAFISVCLLTIILSFWYRQRNNNLRKNAEELRQKSKIQRLEAIYEAEAHLSRRVHDDFSANINQAMHLVENGMAKVEILDKLEIIYNQSRDFSRKINEIDTGKKYTDELFAMLGTNVPAKTKLYITGRKEIRWTHMNPLIKTTLYKILQELMINMKKHSQASFVSVSFSTIETGLKVCYSDNGVGAHPKELICKNGLRNTESRIRAIDGTITFESEEGNGFRSEIQIPN